MILTCIFCYPWSCLLSVTNSPVLNSFYLFGVFSGLRHWSAFFFKLLMSIVQLFATIFVGKILFLSVSGTLILNFSSLAYPNLSNHTLWVVFTSCEISGGIQWDLLSEKDKIVQEYVSGWEFSFKELFLAQSHCIFSSTPLLCSIYKAVWSDPFFKVYHFGWHLTWYGQQFPGTSLA